MKQILDLHLHSKHSRACSPKLTLAGIAEACLIKGVDIVAISDFTHPAWFASIKNELTEINQTGLYQLSDHRLSKIKFILSTELCLIYKAGGKTRRIHLVVMAPNLKAVEELNKQLGARFNLRSDGRPILGLSAPDLVKICLAIDLEFIIFPAHIWTPWYSIFGSKSGFDSLEECFGDQTEFIYAYETGLSSDPEMNWRVSALDELILLSNSDAHSPANIAREANIWNLEKPSYQEIFDILKNKKRDQILGTVEFFPEEGMYHWDGHLACGVVLPPAETKKVNGICPACGRPLTIGVEYRVDELADRKPETKPINAKPYYKLVELDKIIAQAMGMKGRASKTIVNIYNEMISKFGTELDILLEVDVQKLIDFNPRVGEGIRRVRVGKLTIKPGFDGKYGEVVIFNDKLPMPNVKSNSND